MNQELNIFFMVNGNKFPSDSMPFLMKSLENASEDKTKMLFALPLKKPILGLILSFLFGGLGVDRFYKGDVALGFLKLLIVVLYFALVIAVGASLISNPRSFDPKAVGAVMGGGMIFLIIILWIWYIADLFLVYKGIKKDNLNKVMQFLTM